MKVKFKFNILGIFLKKYTKFLLNFVQAQIIHLGLGAVLIFFALYLFSSKFKLFLIGENIDPNFLIGFFTVIALFLSLIQNLKDKKYLYNLNIINSLENRGLKINGKVMAIRSKSAKFLSSATNCIKALNSKDIYKDLSGTLSQEDIDADMELITSSIDAYFPECAPEWNTLLGKLGEIGTISTNILLNYEKEIELITNRISFKNRVLDSSNESLIRMKEIDKEISEIGLSMRNSIVGKINESKGKLKNHFNFKF